MINRISLFFTAKQLPLDDTETFNKNKWIFDFFDQQFSAGVEFWLKDSKLYYKDIAFYFTHSVFSRLRKEEHKKFGRAYEIVSNNVLGTGGAGVVCDILYTISRDQEHYKFKDHCRAIKILHDYDNFLNDPYPEYNIIKQINGRGAKPPISNKAFVMKKIEGVNWWDNSALIDALTIEEKKYLCIALLKAYQQQIYNNNLIHGDIKQGNILIKVNYEKSLKDRFIVNIVDFGNASFKFNDSGSFLTALDLKQLYSYCYGLWDRTELDNHKCIDVTATSLENRIKILEDTLLVSTENLTKKI